LTAVNISSFDMARHQQLGIREDSRRTLASLSGSQSCASPDWGPHLSSLISHRSSLIAHLSSLISHLHRAVRSFHDLICWQVRPWFVKD
jgi:hypothetical protein